MGPVYPGVDVYRSERFAVDLGICIDVDVAYADIQEPALSEHEICADFTRQSPAVAEAEVVLLEREVEFAGRRAQQRRSGRVC